MLLALLVDPASPAAQAIGCDLKSARGALEALDSAALAAIGVEPGITAGPVTVRTQGKLRLTPAAKVIFTGIPDARKDRRVSDPLGGLGRIYFHDPNGHLFELLVPAEP